MMGSREGAPARVALFHGWAQSPVWYRTPHDFGPVDLARLPISNDLREQLVAWNEFADVTLTANDYEWPEPRVGADFTAIGSVLAQELRRELGIEVIYEPDGDVEAPAVTGESQADHVWTAFAPMSGEEFRPGRQRTQGPQQPPRQAARPDSSDGPQPS